MTAETTLVKIVVRVGESGDGDELAALYAWLRQDPEVLETAELSEVSSPYTPGAMGGALEAVDVVVSAGIGVTSLVFACLSWLNTRPRERRPVVRLTVDRVTVEIVDCGPEDARRYVEALTERR